MYLISVIVRCIDDIPITTNVFTEQKIGKSEAETTKSGLGKTETIIIVVVVVGVVLIAVIVAIVIVVCRRRQRRNKR